MGSYPEISINNTLAEAVTVYDAFDNPGDTSLANYFDTLASLGTVTAGARARPAILSRSSLIPAHARIYSDACHPSHKSARGDLIHAGPAATQKIPDSTDPQACENAPGTAS